MSFLGTVFLGRGILIQLSNIKPTPSWGMREEGEAGVGAPPQRERQGANKTKKQEKIPALIIRYKIESSPASAGYFSIA